MDKEKYTVESNTLFLEYIGEETDLRQVQNDKPIKTAEDIRKEQMEKGYVVRKDQPSIAQLRNKTQTKNCLK